MSKPPKLPLGPMDEWSTREQLALASAVVRSGDQNWASVSRMIRVYGEKNRQAEWFSQKNCARQYSSLLDKVEKPKRKRGGTETTGESIVKNLTEERLKELKELIASSREKYVAMMAEIKDIENGVYDDNLADLAEEIKSDSELESSVAECAGNTLTESRTSCDDVNSSNVNLNDKISEDRSDTAGLTTPQEEESPKYEMISPNVATPSRNATSISGPIVSPQLKNLVHTAIAGASAEDERPKTMSPTASAPTLSMLLEMPPRDRGQPLPDIPTLIGSADLVVAAAAESPKKNIFTASLLEERLSQEIDINKSIEMEIESTIIEQETEAVQVEDTESEIGQSSLSSQLETTQDALPSNLLAEVVIEKLDGGSDGGKALTEVSDTSSIAIDTKRTPDTEPITTKVVVLPTESHTISSETNKVVELLKNKPTSGVSPKKGASDGDTLLLSLNSGVANTGPLSTSLSLSETASSVLPPFGQVVDLMEQLPDSGAVPLDDIEIVDLNDKSMLISGIFEISSDSKVDSVHISPVKQSETLSEKAPLLISNPSEIAELTKTKEVVKETDTVDAAVPMEIALSDMEDVVKDGAAEIVPMVVPLEIEKKVVEAAKSTTVEPSDKIEDPVVAPTPTEEKAVPATLDIEIKKDEISAQDNKPPDIVKSIEVEEKPPSKSKPVSTEDSVEKLQDLELVVSLSKLDDKSPDITQPERRKSADVEQEKGKNHYIGRGKKAFVVTVVENEKGEKVELKTADGASIKVTRNLSKETGLKIEDLPYSKKSLPASTKEKEEKDAAATTPNRRGAPRTSETPKTPYVVNIRPTSAGGNKKSVGKGVSSEIKTPNLRSRGGTTPTPISSAKEDAENKSTGNNVVESKSAAAAEELQESGSKSEEAKTDGGSAPGKIADVSNVKEGAAEKSIAPPSSSSDIAKDKLKEAKEDSDNSGDELSDTTSDFGQNKKGSAYYEGDTDESDASRNANSSTKTHKARKERLESADMADDDSSNSANDATAKRRVTRRSMKTSPRKTEPKVRTNEEKPTYRNRERLSLPLKDTTAGDNKPGRPSKAVSRVKHLSEEAHLIYGDLDTETADGTGKRITRARAKTCTTPGKSATPTKNVAPSSEPETSSDTEQKARSTRSRTAAAAATTTTSSNYVIDHLPPVVMDSAPSSPCSSTTNSTIIDEDKDQRAFRKSILLVWNRIAALKNSSLFLKPISEDKAPGYFDKIKRPMDLSTIKRNVELGRIRSFVPFERDIYLMFLNCFMYNEKENEVTEMAQEMERDVRQILDEHKKMWKIHESGDTSVSERVLRRDSRNHTASIPDATLPISTNISDSDAELDALDEIGKVKGSSESINNRKKRAGSNSLEVADDKKRKTRTSNSTSTSQSQSTPRKVKAQISPDIVVGSYDLP